MKKILSIMLIASLVFTFSAYAHAPSDIDLSYNPVTEVLKVKISHPVLDIDKHYIAEVNVSVDGNKVINHKIAIQDNTDSQTLSYTLPGVSRGDRIEVEASCSIGGVRTKLLEIE
ncbi:MAG: hypothetical protein P9L88_02390 [Candidatus Tantalella remota]|nr:hypothetical protein [Candidatus Tantalella remota]